MRIYGISMMVSGQSFSAPLIDRWTGMLLLYPLAPLADIMSIIIITVLLRLLFISISSLLFSSPLDWILDLIVGPGDIKR